MPLLPPVSSVEETSIGRRDPNGGHFGQQAEDVLVHRGAFRGAGPVVVVFPAMNDTSLVGFLEAKCHGGADHVLAAEDQRVLAHSYRVGVRRNEDARTGGAHLVLVEPDLRFPIDIGHASDSLRFLLRKHVPVTIVVMSDIVVVEERHLAALIFRAEILLVPVDHHDLAVGIQRRHDQQDDFVETFLDRRIVGGDEFDAPTP